MSYTEINNLYYGPASQAYIKKHGLACPFNPLWVDYKLLMAILFGSKSSSGGFLCTIENDEMNYIYNKGGRDKLNKYTRFVNEDCIVTINNKQYICFIQVINAAYAAHGIYEIKELAKLPYNNILQSRLEHFGSMNTTCELALQHNNLSIVKNTTKISEQTTVLEEWQPIYGVMKSSKDTEVLYLVSCTNKGRDVIKFGYTGNFQDRMAQYRCDHTNVVVHDMLLVHSEGKIAEDQLLQYIKERYQPCFGFEWFDIPIMIAKKLFYEFREQYEHKIHCDIKEFERSAFRYVITNKERYSDDELLILSEFISMKEFITDVKDINSIDYNVIIIVPWELDRIMSEKIYKINGTIERENIIMPVRACNMRNDLKCNAILNRRGVKCFFKSNDMIFCIDDCVLMFDKFDNAKYNDVEYYDNDDKLVIDYKK